MEETRSTVTTTLICRDTFNILLFDFWPLSSSFVIRSMCVSSQVTLMFMIIFGQCERFPGGECANG